MTSPDQQARGLRDALERQRLARESGREISAQIARERQSDSEKPAESEGES